MRSSRVAKLKSEEMHSDWIYRMNTKFGEKSLVLCIQSCQSSSSCLKLPVFQIRKDSGFFGQDREDEQDEYEIQGGRYSPCIQSCQSCSKTLYSDYVANRTRFPSRIDKLLRTNPNAIQPRNQSGIHGKGCKGECGVIREICETREENADAKKYEMRFNRLKL